MGSSVCSLEQDEISLQSQISYFFKNIGTSTQLASGFETFLNEIKSSATLEISVLHSILSS
jgi:hypothetical protein